MEAILKGDPKEIAALVLAIQGQRTQAVKLSIDGKKFGKALYRKVESPAEAIWEAVQTAIHDKPAAN